MRLSIGSKIAAGFLLALGALLIIGAVSNVNLRQFMADASWVSHTIEVQQKLEGLQAGLLQAESSSRGYSLVPNAAFKDLFKEADIQANANFRKLRDLVQDNPVQEERLDRLDPLIRRRLDVLQKLIDLRDASPASAQAEQTILVTEGQEAMAQIRQLISQMMDEEAGLLKERQTRESSMADLTSATITVGTLIAVVLVGVGGWLITRSITIPLGVLGDGAAKIGGGDYTHRVEVTSRDEVGHLAGIFNRMAGQIEQRQRTLAEQDWLKTSLAQFATLFQGQRNPATLCHAILADLAPLLQARHSLFYVSAEHAGQPRLQLQAAYAADGAKTEIAPGEGLVGESFVTSLPTVLEDVPADYLRIKSALGEARPRAIVVQPAVFDGKVKAVLELALAQKPKPIELAFLTQLAESIGVVLQNIEASARTEALLQQAQLLSQDLQARQSELAAKNEELEIQTVRLRGSELQLQEQQEELKQTNEELEQTNEEMQQTNEEMEEKVNLLAAQKKEMERVNREIEAARRQIEEKASQLASASKYKSQFLANMSHELRTPLNSLLILSKLLSDNPSGNLTEKQVQYAQTISSSGNDLLELINEILDLSKIESGSVEIDATEVDFSELRDFVEQTFRHVAESKQLDFEIDLDPALPATIATDLRRTEQVLKNLLANAFKFTERGSVALRVRPVTVGWDRRVESLNKAEKVIAFAVTDTGIGIPEEKHRIIFDAFQQAEAGTARRFGGTGLGLSISREIAHLLGGSLQVTSTPDRGSTFTLYLPAVYVAENIAAPAVSRAEATPSSRPAAPAPAAPAPPAAPEAVLAEPSGLADDRAAIVPGDTVLLVIEDDLNFAQIIMDFAREKRFKVVVARTAAQGLAWARRLGPAAITLDLHLPDNDGWTVLDQLKHDPATRHIPIHVMSVDEERERSLRLGAVSYFQKPVTREILEEALSQTLEFINRPLKNLLIIEDDPAQRQSLVELIGNGDVKSTAVGSGAEALQALGAAPFDCVVLDLGLPDLDGFQLIREIHRLFGPHAPPIVVYTGQELTRQQETELRLISESIVIKNVRSPERLLDETALFLHRVQTRLPEPKRRMIEQGQKNESILAGRKVLVVDDDVRNIFAVTSALEAVQMEVIYAESGQEALDLLDRRPDIEIVLMDVMMPGMDGYEATRRIRGLERFRRLPIISVTAKAMKGDREKCLEAGASDYITKPVDMDQLKSLLRVWLYR
jgi:CheY-like chemotaxis protein/CHASE3 domain sensor protein